MTKEEIFWKKLKASLMHFSATARNEVILTAKSTRPVSAMTRTMSKKVKRFLLVGRVVRKKLTRATQQKLEAVKESRQRSKIIAAAISQIVLSNTFFLSVLLTFDIQGEEEDKQPHYCNHLPTYLVHIPASCPSMIVWIFNQVMS